jgi:hypothetical protein
MLGFFAKLYPRVSGLAATPDLKVIFIILIITLNLHDPSLNGFSCNTRPNSFECGSGCKVVS